MYTIVTGDTALILQTLKVGASAFDVSGFTIKSRLISLHGGTPLTDAVENSSNTSGADWENGIVAVVIPGAQTADINAEQHPTVLLETQVDDGTYQKTWFSEIALVTGTID